MRSTSMTPVLLGAILAMACGKKKPSEAQPATTAKAQSAEAAEAAQGSEPVPLPPLQLEARHAALTEAAKAFVEEIAKLEKARDVTCWTSFRQLDNFISSKTYSDFATLTKIVAIKALVRSVWVAASQASGGEPVTAQRIEEVFSIEAELPEAKKAELEKFAETLGWQQFHDYRTTSEHWRILLSVVTDELASPQPALAPLSDDGRQALALVTTRLALSLLTEAGALATEARTPLIEADHVKKAYATLLARHEIPEKDAPAGTPDHATAKVARMHLTKGLIDAKIEALRHYNQATDDLHAEMQKISKIPITPEAVAKLEAELRAFTEFFVKGYEPMRADNYLADGNFAPSDAEGKDYVDAAHVENVTVQLFPYVIMPNGDVKLRFEQRPGHISMQERQPQDVTLLDHHMNAIRDTAIHWVVLERIFAEQPFAMDAFAAEYLSELVSIVATYWVRRAQTLATQAGAKSVTLEHMSQVRDLGYVMVMPTDDAAASWGPQRQKLKQKVLAQYGDALFEDVTAAWGLPTELRREVQGQHPGSDDFDIQEVMGSGIAVGDIDGDGVSDVFLAGEGLGRLYLNKRKESGEGRHFVDVTEAWGIVTPLPDSRGALMVDYDGDGDLDLLVLRSREPSLLLENRDGKLVDVAKEKGLVTGRGAHVATFFDYDGDGDLDVYVGYYGSAACNAGACPDGRNLPSLDGRNGTPNQLLRNDGGRFTEVGAVAGAADEGWTLAVGAFDYDLDGDLDLYLANDFGANPLLRNDGDGTFTDVALELGAADRGSGMNVSFADLDGNGAWDVFVSNIDMFSKNIKIVFPTDESTVKLSDKILRSFQYLSGNKLYFNVMDGDRRRFEPREGVWFEPGDRGWGWAGIFFDYDLDGDEDIYLANGWIPRSPAADQKNQMFVNEGETFYMGPVDAPEAFAGNSRSVVALDIDGDGDLDLLVNNYAQPPRLLENVQATKRHWLKVRVGGAGANTRAVGASVEVVAGKRTMRRLVTCGIGYLGQDEETVHFGLGAAKKADVTVTWPDGRKHTVRGVRADQVHEIARPQPEG
jgi:enediyne biosynthesis protein E4